MIEIAWLLPTLPALGFAIIALATNRCRLLSALIAIASMAASLIISLGIAFEVFQRGITMVNPLEYSIDWLSISGLSIRAGILIDPLTAVMLIVVCTVALLVDIYSLGYMSDDPGFSRYFGFMSLFGASMLGLVIANNYFQMYFFWELVGLSSYLLIGFYFGKHSAAQANKKAFIANRVADFGFLLGFLYLFLMFGTFNFGELAGLIPAHANTAMLTLAAILVFIGPIGKSAQFPLHVWLPDAMEGPTPVSALIHAATMVAAGVYLVARQYVLFANAETALLVIAYLGGFTALFAATIAIVNTDIKRILAYSTLSQLGYMMMALGVGSLTAGMFHLSTHAFFKSLLFLCAGSVIHAVHSNDIWKMGGLYKKMPITTWTFMIGSLALAGIFPLAGFWSKDEILVATKSAGFMGLYLLGTFVAFLTAFYMFRLIFITFFGESRTEKEAHESPPSMTIPLVILAVLSVIAGFAGAPFIKNGFWAYVGVVERLMGLEIPEKAEYMRIILGELQRIASHLVYTASYALDMNGFTPWMYMFRDREKILDLLEMTTGSRLTVNAMRVGGMPNEFPLEFYPAVEKLLDELPICFEEYDGIITGNEIFQARTKNVGKMDTQTLINYGVGGPNLRASGLKYDLRKDAPYSIYDRFDFDVPTGKQGDSFDRWIIRMEEMRQSTKIIKQALEQMPQDGPIMAKVPKTIKPPKGEAYFHLEGSKGWLGFYLVSDGSPKPYRLHIHPPSLISLGALPEMAKGGYVQDFIATLASIDIVLGEVDR